MPAKSKSQQRLFGMVHAYNKGELHGSRSLRSRIARLSKHISDDDARHFAQTPHDGLPEKKAQAYLRPEQVQALIARLPPVDYSQMIPREDKEEQKSVIGSALKGAILGGAISGIGLGIGGGALSLKSTAGQPAADRLAKLLAAVYRTGTWGLTRGAATGAIASAGLNVYNRIRS